MAYMYSHTHPDGRVSKELVRRAGGYLRGYGDDLGIYAELDVSLSNRRWRLKRFSDAIIEHRNQIEFLTAAKRMYLAEIKERDVSAKREADAELGEKLRAVWARELFSGAPPSWSAVGRAAREHFTAEESE